MPGWSPELYAANTAHMRVHDNELLEQLTIDPGWRVLDLGCGVGELADVLASIVPDGRVIGIDASPSMISVASRRTRPNLEFMVCKAQDLRACFPDPAQFGLVVSTAVFHWIPEGEHPAILRELRRLLRPGGLLRAEFGGHGQIAAARAILNAESSRLGGPVDPWFFPDEATYRGLLAGAGFVFDPIRVRLVHQRRRFPDAERLLGWLRSQVLIAYEAQMPEEAASAFRARVEDRAVRELRRPDGSYDQDYVRLHVWASVPG